MTRSIPLVTVVLLVVSCGGGGGSGNSTPAVNSPPAPMPDPVPDPDPEPMPPPAPSFVDECNSPATADLALTFSEISVQAGLAFSHSVPGGDDLFGQSGGVAAGDVDADGLVDLYAIGGTGRPNLLLLNQGDGSFADAATAWGLDISGKFSGPSFGDLNGDNLLDLFVGSVSDTSPRLFLNEGDNSFRDITEQSQLVLPGNNLSASWGDYNNDQVIDLFVTHWTRGTADSFAYLWKNNGDLSFTDISDEAAIRWESNSDKTFSPTFADIDNDGWQDLLVVADGGGSKAFRNLQNGSFDDITNGTFTDRSGMGSAVGDYDNDGDLDWFVSAIQTTDGVVLDAGWGTEGNRLYENLGDGVFMDATDMSGVRDGRWGWGACFADFNNDGHLDIFHVNGMEDQDPIFANDLSRLFMANGDKTFTESAQAAGIQDDGQGRGVVCFDYDRDGDQDIYVANYDQPPKLYCNHGNSHAWLNVRLNGSTTNTQALGARIYVTTSDDQQMRELNSGNNYVSQNPVEAHFGLGDASMIDELRIVWPDQTESILNNVEVNQFLVLEQGNSD